MSFKIIFSDDDRIFVFRFIFRNFYWFLFYVVFWCSFSSDNVYEVCPGNDRFQRISVQVISDIYLGFAHWITNESFLKQLNSFHGRMSKVASKILCVFILTGTASQYATLFNVVSLLSDATRMPIYACAVKFIRNGC